MSTDRERQAKRRAKIKANPELYQAQFLKDRERKKRQREAQREKMSEQQLQEHNLKQDHDISIRWNFFATSHGKGVVDGIGGTVKRSVWRHIQSERSHITTPQEYSALTSQTALPKHSSWIHCQEWGWSTICISGCQMGRDDGSPPSAQGSLYSSFWCGWGQSSWYYQWDGEMFPSLNFPTLQFLIFLHTSVTAL